MMHHAMFALSLILVAADPARELPVADGFHGIWYANQKSNDEYVYKYSGGMATYPQQHNPIAIHSPEANKTFFCYGGTTREADTRELLHMVSYFDHATGEVARPRILLNKKTSDAHDNPTISIDEQGYLWIFSNAHGTGRPAFIHRSTEPYSIDSFTRTRKTNFSYSQPWYFPGKGFLFLHTRYKEGRRLFWMASADGMQWTEPSPLAYVAQGHYQISWPHGNRLSTAFNYHPAKGGLNARTNLYYLETADWGAHWRTVSGEEVTTPISDVHDPSLVRDYESEGLLVYLKDIQYDSAGRPILLYLTSKGYEAGPKNGPRQWTTARWTDREWEFRPVTTSDNNYDFGSLYIESDNHWRLIAPTDPGPQPFNPGGEVALWETTDRGEHWRKVKVLTRESSKNHTFIRRPRNVHPDFYALWADGHGRQPSDSSLYFTNRACDHVWRLPVTMNTPTAKPEIAW